MAKLLLMSILIVSVAIPMWTAREKNGKSGAKKTMVYFAAYTAFWIVFSAFYYKDMLGPVDLDPFGTKKKEEERKMLGQ